MGTRTNLTLNFNLNQKAKDDGLVDLLTSLSLNTRDYDRNASITEYVDGAEYLSVHPEILSSKFFNTEGWMKIFGYLSDDLNYSDLAIHRNMYESLRDTDSPYLVLHTNIKSYDDQVINFLELLEPYVDQMQGDIIYAGTVNIDNDYDGNYRTIVYDHSVGKFKFYNLGEVDDRYAARELRNR